MNYVIYDLEYNQRTKESKKIMKFLDRKPLTYNFYEIMQIGSVMVDEEFKLVDKFNIYVKPFFYKEISHDVTKVTGIDIDKLNRDGRTFKTAFLKFDRQYLKGYGYKDIRFIVWTIDDAEVMRMNMKEMQLKSMTHDYNNFIILQPIVMKLLNLKQRPSLIHAADLLGVENVNSMGVHDAYIDALLCKNVFLKLIEIDKKESLRYTNVYKYLKENRKIPLAKKKAKKMLEVYEADIECSKCGSKNKKIDKTYICQNEGDRSKYQFAILSVCPECAITQMDKVIFDKEVKVETKKTTINSHNDITLQTGFYKEKEKNIGKKCLNRLGNVVIENEEFPDTISRILRTKFSNIITKVEYKEMNDKEQEIIISMLHKNYVKLETHFSQEDKDELRKQKKYYVDFIEMVREKIDEVKNEENQNDNEIID